MGGIGIVIVSYRTGGTLARCLDAVHADVPEALVHLVDHDSQPVALEALLGERPWIRPLDTTENPGFGSGANRGIETALAAGVSHVLLLNDDVFVRSGCVARLVAAAGDAGAASPWLAGDGDAAYRGGVIDWERGYAGHRDGATDYLLGGCMMISRAAWERTGPFDAAFFLYCEDVDWCIRARTAGVPLVVVPAELAEHVGGASTGQDDAWAYWWSRSRIRLLRKHGRGSPWQVGLRQLAGVTRTAVMQRDLRVASARIRGTLSGLGARD